METDLYSFAFRGILAEEALDKAGHKKYTAEEAFFSESLAKELHFDEIDSKYVEQSKTMITVFATITAFETQHENLFSQHLLGHMATIGGQKVYKTVLERKRKVEKILKPKSNGI